MNSLISTVVIAGPTGVGKSLALQQLEVLGFVGVDGVAAGILPHLHSSMRQHHPRLAYVLDLRHPRLIDEALHLALWCQEQGIPMLYLDASVEILIRRQTTSRRRHPFVVGSDLPTGIQSESQYLEPLRACCSHTLDTTRLHPLQLRDWLGSQVGGSSVPLMVNLISFGYKFGLPTDANLVFDIRFLPNPYFVAHLRSLSGLDPALREHLFASELVQQTYDRLRDLIQDWIPAYQAEQRAYLNIAVGCTGGQHRSVSFVEQLAADLSPPDWDPGNVDGTMSSAAPSPYKLTITHRHLQQSQQDISHSPALWDPQDHA